MTEASSGQAPGGVRFRGEGPLGLVTLDRPDKLNAIDQPMIAALHTALDALARDDAVRAIVVSGEGRAFSAGFDLSGGTAMGDVGATRRLLEADFDLILRFWDCPKPTVAAVHGYCLGGAFELAMACDLTVASADCRLGEPEPKFGSGIVALILPWLVGPKHAKELLLTGEDRFSAQRAYEIGLVNRVCAPETLMETATDLARRMAILDRTAVSLTKQAINRSYDIMGMRQALLAALETDVIIESTQTPESTEFNRVLSEQGLKAALAWRRERFG